MPIPGALRLLLELGFFAAAVLCLWSVGQERAAVGFALIVILHYAISYDRIVWLLAALPNEPPSPSKERRGPLRD